MGRFKKVLLWLFVSIVVAILGLILLLSTPSRMYAHSTVINQITVYHNEPIPAHLRSSINEALRLVERSALYDANLKSDLCLNDGSQYPKLVENVLGSDVFAAFKNKVVVLGHDKGKGEFEQWGQSLSFAQFLAHGLMHNYQYDYHGFWGANPMGRHPNWKWEGYVEYSVLGESTSLEELMTLIQGANDDYEWKALSINRSTLVLHLKYLMLTTYCLDVKGWSYADFMKSRLTYDQLQKEMMDWLKVN